MTGIETDDGPYQFTGSISIILPPLCAKAIPVPFANGTIQFAKAASDVALSGHGGWALPAIGAEKMTTRIATIVGFIFLVSTGVQKSCVENIPLVDSSRW